MSDKNTTGDNLSQKSGDLPAHLGFIVDGNRRWARERNLPTFEGHRRGLDKVEMVIEELAKTEVKFVSFYLFSTENWHRSSEEVDYLMQMVKDNLSRLLKKLEKQNIRTLIFGSENCPRPDVWQEITETAERTAGCTGMTVCICFNYGGQQEIAEAATRVVRKRLAQGDDSAVEVEELAGQLYCPEVPPVDMVVRTSGEQRISNFMLWRVAYAEFLFLKNHFPDMTPEVVQEVLEEYSRRQRRFGK